MIQTLGLFYQRLWDTWRNTKKLYSAKAFITNRQSIKVFRLKRTRAGTNCTKVSGVFPPCCHYPEGSRWRCCPHKRRSWSTSEPDILHSRSTWNVYCKFCRIPWLALLSMCLFFPLLKLSNPTNFAELSAQVALPGTLRNWPKQQRYHAGTHGSLYWFASTSRDVFTRS